MGVLLFDLCAKGKQFCFDGTDAVWRPQPAPWCAISVTALRSPGFCFEYQMTSIFPLALAVEYALLLSLDVYSLVKYNLSAYLPVRTTWLFLFTKHFLLVSSILWSLSHKLEAKIDLCEIYGARSTSFNATVFFPQVIVISESLWAFTSVSLQTAPKLMFNRITLLAVRAINFGTCLVVTAFRKTSRDVVKVYSAGCLTYFSICDQSAMFLIHVFVHVFCHFLSPLIETFFFFFARPLLIQQQCFRIFPGM